MSKQERVSKGTGLTRGGSVKGQTEFVMVNDRRCCDVLSDASPGTVSDFVVVCLIFFAIFVLESVPPGRNFFRCPKYKRIMSLFQPNCCLQTTLIRGPLFGCFEKEACVCPC